MYLCSTTIRESGITDVITLKANLQNLHHSLLWASHPLIPIHVVPHSTAAGAVAGALSRTGTVLEAYGAKTIQPCRGGLDTTR